MGTRARRQTVAARCALAATLLAGALLFTGCGSSRTSADSGTVNFLIEASPTNLDPRIGADSYSEHIDGLIFSSLVARDARMKVIPDLAESWETPDPLTYVFHLRHGVKFHDGRPLNSADVKFTFDSILSGAVKTPKRGSFKLVASVEAPDDATVVIHLREPYASLLWNLTAPGIGIVPRASGAEISQHPVGTGPFRFVSATTDEEIVLARNDGYFGGAPKIETPAFAYRAGCAGARARTPKGFGGCDDQFFDAGYGRYTCEGTRAACRAAVWYDDGLSRF